MRSAIGLRRAQKGAVRIVHEPRDAGAASLARVHPCRAVLALVPIVSIETEARACTGAVPGDIHGIVAAVRLVAPDTLTVWIRSSVQIRSVACTAVLRRVVCDRAELALTTRPPVAACAAARAVCKLDHVRSVGTAV